jgi:hypothetical protein
MAYSENFSSDVRNQLTREIERRSAEYCEQRATQQYQGGDHENTAMRTSRTEFNAAIKGKNRDNNSEVFNYNSKRLSRTDLSSPAYDNRCFSKGQDNPCKNDFNYRS